MIERLLPDRRALIAGLGAVAIAALSMTAESNVAIAAPRASMYAASGSSLTSFVLNRNSPRTYHISPDGHIQELAWGGGWHTTDISASSGAVPAAPGSSLTSFSLNGGYPRVYYTSAEGHIRELAWGGGWHATDITASSRAVPAAPGSSLTSVALNGSSPRVYYLSSEGHVRELAWGGGWHATDISASSGAVPAAPGSSLTSIALNGRYPRIYYLSPDGHIQQLAWAGWQATDITASSGTVPAAPGSSLTSFTVTVKDHVTGKDEPPAYSVYYVSPDGHVRELSGGPTWASADLSAAGGQAPPAAPGSSLTALVLLGSYLRIYYLSSDGHVQELAAGNGWHVTDISAGSGAVAAVPGSSLTSLAVTSASLTSADNPRVYYASADGHVQELAWGQGWHATDLGG